MTSTQTRKRSSSLAELWHSTIGKKIFVAVTGAILVGYVVLHMVGNLNALAGAGGPGGEARIDRYGDWIRNFGQPLLPHAFLLWAIRAVLLVAVVIHIVAVLQLRQRNRNATPNGMNKKVIRRTWSSRAMTASGLLLLVFIVFHILQFTTLTIDVTPLRDGAIYANLFGAFQKWYFVLFYVLAVISLGLHLHHGLWSGTQTLGLDTPDRNRTIRRWAAGVSLVVTIGFALTPTLFWFGALPDPAPADLTQTTGSVR